MITGQRILFICSWYPTPEDHTLGIFIRKHAVTLAEAGNEVVTWSFRYVKDPMQGGFNIERAHTGMLKEYCVVFNYGSKWSKLFVNYKAIKTLASECAASTFQKVVLQVFDPAWKYWFMVRHLFRVSPSLVEHWSGYLPEDGRFRKNGLTAYALRSMAPQFKTFFVISAYQQKAIEQLGVSARFQLIPNVLDERIFFVDSNVKKHTTFTILHISNLNEQEKQIGLLIRFFELVRKQHPAIRLHIAGGKKERVDELKRSLQSNPFFEAITFEGMLDPVQVADRMRAAHVTVLSSRFEGQPVVLLESIACGTPVLAPMVGGIPDFVNVRSGRLYERDNLTQMIEKFEEIASHYDSFDPVRMSTEVYGSHGRDAILNAYANA